MTNKTLTSEQQQIIAITIEDFTFNLNKLNKICYQSSAIKFKWGWFLTYT